MNIKKLFGQHLGVVVAILAAVAAVTADAAELDRSPARVTQAAAGKPLTAASRATPEAIVAGYLRSKGRAPAVLSSLRTAGKSTGANRVTHLQMEQVVDGLKVQGAYVKAAINSRGELVHVIDRTVAVSNPTPSRINAGQAVRAAMAAVHPTKTELVLRPAGKKGNTTLFGRVPAVRQGAAVVLLAQVRCVREKHSSSCTGIVSCLEPALSYRRLSTRQCRKRTQSVRWLPMPRVGPQEPSRRASGGRRGCRLCRTCVIGPIGGDVLVLLAAP